MEDDCLRLDEMYPHQGHVGIASTVVDSDALALGARIMTRIQTALPVAAAIRVDVVIALS